MNKRNNKYFMIILFILLFLNLSSIHVCSMSDTIPIVNLKFACIVLFFTSILIFLTFSCYLFFFYKNNCLTKSQLELEQNKHNITLSYLHDSVWEYVKESDSLTKLNPLQGIFLGQRIIPNFSKYFEQNTLVHPEDTYMFYDLLKIDGHMKEKYCEVRAKDENGEYIWYGITGKILTDENNKLISIIGHTKNIQQKKAEEERVQTLSKQDSLTRLLNHTSTEQEISSYINRLEEPKILAFFVIDIDNFSSVNDSLGYLYGDAVLISLSSKLQSIFDEKDIIGRVSGDEFIILMSDVPTLDMVQQKAFTICHAFHDIYLGDNTPFQLSGSIGISIYPQDATSFISLYEKADSAMHHAKYNGKDRFCIYSDGMAQLSEPYKNLKFQEYFQNNVLSEERSFENSSIIATVIDLLFDSKEIDTSIHMVLALIGTYFKLGRIHLFEYENNNTSISITHEWSADPKDKIISVIQNIAMTDITPYLYFSGQPNGIFICNDTAELFREHDNNSCSLLYDEVKSFLQCAINDHGRTLGFITVNVLHQNHTFSRGEINTITLLCKVVGTYLFHLRSIQKVDMISQKDILTGSYNLSTFLTVANLLLQVNPITKYAIFYIDIKDFKLFNDTYGYSSGDFVLKSLASIYRKVGGDSAILSRITGDRFLLLFSYIIEEELQEKAEDIIQRSKQISNEKNEAYKFFLSIGIYLMNPLEDAIIGIDRANIARKKAVLKYNTSYAFFDESMLKTLVETKQIEDMMESSLENGEFIVYYQPKINMGTSTITGAEALIRWNRPNIGLVSPDSFIPIFEKNGFIVNVDFYVLETVCKFLRHHIDNGDQVFPISVNFSREHFKTNALPDKLKTMVDKYQIPCSLIEVEITESAISISDHFRATILNRIRSHGFLLAMDDFGSGLSSLHLLCDLPFDVLKIDKDFFHTKTTSKAERIVISNVVKMALELNMEVICEGVETKEQVEFLQSIGCMIAQGYYYDKPLPKDVFQEKYLLPLSTQKKES